MKIVVCVVQKILQEYCNHNGVGEIGIAFRNAQC